jgi:NDP-sugar pyrophosphorylase family protein
MVGKEEGNDLERALEDLRRAICDTSPPAHAARSELQRFADNCVVALPVGGQGSRLQSITERFGVQKNALRLPDGDTMLARTIRMYRDAGFCEFVALVFHRADSVIEALGNGEAFGVRIAYSHDPVIPVGRGGAIRNALDSGAIPSEKYLIVHNPDDVIARYPGSFPADVVAAHLAGEERGMIATAVMVDGARVPYTGMRIAGGVVEEVIAYPFVPVPAHTGVTLFSPAVYAYFRDLFDLTRKVDFEAVLFPRLSAERKLFAMVIPNQYWLQVNDPKSLDKLAELVREEQGLSES